MINFKRGDFVLIKDIHFVKTKFPSQQIDRWCRVSGFCNAKRLEIELYYLGKPLGIGTYLDVNQLEAIQNQEMMKLLYG